MTRTSDVAAALRRLPRQGLPKLGRLAPGEVLCLVAAPVALPLVALALRLLGLRRVQRVLLRGGARTPSLRDDGAARARRLSWCVHVAAAYGPWPANCLQRSLVLLWYLHLSGIECDLLIGVRREHDALDFHAWVEHEGRVLNDRRDVRKRYAVFDRPMTTPVARFS